MKAIILAAGKGTRLDKYTSNLPKCMLNFAGKTLLKRQIDCLRESGINDIIIVKGYMDEKIDYPDVKYYVNDNFSSTNMVMSLMCAKDEFNDDILVCYADIIYEKRLIKKLIEADADFNVLCDIKWKDYWLERYGRIDFDYEGFAYDDSKSITSIGNSEVDINDIDARYIGLLKFSKNGIREILKFLNKEREIYLSNPWRNIKRSIDKAYMTDLLNFLIADGKTVKAVETSGGWLEFDTNEDYEIACEWTKNKKIYNFINIDIKED